MVINLPTASKAEAEKLTLEDIQAIVRERFEAEVPLYDPVWISPFNGHSAASWIFSPAFFTPVPTS